MQIKRGGVERGRPSRLCVAGAVLPCHRVKSRRVEAVTPHCIGEGRRELVAIGSGLFCVLQQVDHEPLRRRVLRECDAPQQAITTSVATTATGRTRPAVANAIEQLESCGVLIPLSQSAQNRAWEAVGLLDLIVALESRE